MDQADPANKTGILSYSPGDRPFEPDVVAAGGDFQQTTDSANWIGGLMRLYEREDPGRARSPGRTRPRPLPRSPNPS